MRLGALGPTTLSGLSDHAKGVLCLIGVTFLFTCMDSSAKALSETYEPFFVVWARYFGQAVGALLIFAPRLPELLQTQNLGLQILRSGLLFGATILFFTSFALMPLANVIAVAQVAPLLITAMAALVLAEKVGPYRWAGVAVGFVGAVVVVSPGLAGGVGWVALLPLAAAACFAAYSIATRFLSADERVWTTFLYTGSVGAIAASCAVPFFWSTPRLEDAPLLIGVAAFGAFGQLLLIYAMRFAPASVVAPYFYVALIWAALFGFVFFGETPGVWTILGAALIVGAGLYVRHRERLRARQDAARAKTGP